eukprot:3723743-Pyramimonas_sp.AAC.1
MAADTIFLHAYRLNACVPSLRINKGMVFLPGSFLRSSFDRFKQSLLVGFASRDSPRCHRGSYQRKS